MKIMLVHNYLRPPSGENTVFEQEKELLISKDNSVITYTRHNSEIDNMGLKRKALIPFQAIWSSKTYYDLVQIIRREKPDIAYFHNTFPLISPSAYRACMHHGIPVVQTLHNYRLVCPGALLFRNNTVCTECLGNKFIPSIKFGCYRNSRLLTAGVVMMILFHKLSKTWQDAVSLYIALSDFAKDKYKELGFPSNDFFVKPNFIQDPVTPEYSDDGYGIYIGRIGEEKGLNCLMTALKNCPNVRVRVVGNGPCKDYLMNSITELGLQNIEYLGPHNHKECMDLLLKSRFHLLPSQCYEGIPMALLEAMAAGKPSLVSDLGVLPLMVENEVDGLLFHVGSAEDLTRKITWINEHPDEANQMGKRARRRFEEKYTADKNYQLLMAAYERAIEIHGRKNGKN